MIICNIATIFFVLEYMSKMGLKPLFIISLTRWLKPTAMDSRNINKVCVKTINQGNYPLS
jgi:hypothetical protein